MISNDLVMPVLLRWTWLGLNQWPDFSHLILTIRRSAIVILLLLSYGYFRLIAESQSLVLIGLISFAHCRPICPPLSAVFIGRQATASAH